MLSDPFQKAEEEKQLTKALKNETLEAEKKKYAKGINKYQKGLSINDF